jgi:oligoendopeptidase F
MTSPLPDYPALLDWTWAEIEPHYAELAERPLTADGAAAWLADWSALTARVHELGTRLWVATTLNTADEGAVARHQAYLDQIFPPAEAAEQRLKQKLLDSGLEPAGFELPLRNVRAEAALFRQANLPLLSESKKLDTRYDQIVGAQAVAWEGQEITLPLLKAEMHSPDRARREAAWRLGHARWLADRDALNRLWTEYMRLRLTLAGNADFGRDYRAYRWQQLLRHDYMPDDCLRFQAAIEEVVVPAAERLYARHSARLNLDRLRPWDLTDGEYGRPPELPGTPPMRPFETGAELAAGCSRILHQVHPVFGGYFDTLQREGLLDLDNRRHKAPGGYQEDFPATGRPFIFMNAVGLPVDVDTLLHEAGHAFHFFESAALPYLAQRRVGWEFAEVASMSMELLASPYLGAETGGFYTPAEAARARRDHLEDSLLFWPYMAVVDGFQHWVYTHPEAGSDPAACDAAWDQLWQRFMRGVDWTGLESERCTGWHRKAHIHQEPFYYVEYGLALLGAVQVWGNAQRDQAGAVERYRQALALGGTATLPRLFAAAGAQLAFDPPVLRRAVEQIEDALARLETQAA